MARRTYETRDTLAAEEEAAKIYAEAIGADLQKLPRRYEIDYMLTRSGKMVGWLEVKCRPGCQRHQTYAVSAAKIDKGCRLAERFGGSFELLVVRTSDAMVLDALSERPVGVTIGGRTDRGDADDVEPMAHYAWASFRGFNLFRRGVDPFSG